MLNENAVAPFIILTFTYYSIVVWLAYSVAALIVRNSPEHLVDRHRVWAFPILLVVAVAVSKAIATFTAQDHDLFMTVPWVIEFALTTGFAVVFYGICLGIWRMVARGRFPLLGIRMVAGAVSGILALVCYLFFVFLGFIIVTSMVGLVVGFLVTPFIMTLGPVGGVVVLAWITTGEFPWSLGVLTVIMALGLVLNRSLSLPER